MCPVREHPSHRRSALQFHASPCVFNQEKQEARGGSAGEDEAYGGEVAQSAAERDKTLLTPIPVRGS